MGAIAAIAGAVGGLGALAGIAACAVFILAKKKEPLASLVEEAADDTVDTTFDSEGGENVSQENTLSEGSDFREDQLEGL
jgi:hypothetical protein